MSREKQEPELGPRSLRDLLDEHGLPLAFLAAVASGIFMSIQVLTVALSESATVNLDQVRAERCYEAQREAAAAFAEKDPAALLDWGEETSLPLSRPRLARLARHLPPGAQLFCPEQGPLRSLDLHHYVLDWPEGEKGVSLSCRRHGPAPEEDGT